MKKALITGIAGQDGSYLAEYLLSLGYEVHGILRRNSVPEHQESRLDNIEDKITTYYGDMTDQSSLETVLQKVKPDEIYNLAAQSHVRISFDIPQFTMQSNGNGVLNLLEACRKVCPNAKIYQASSSEMFGNSVDPDGFQRETTLMNPVSPYGCSKLYAFSICKNYRHSYKMHICNGILFNHETVASFMPMLFSHDKITFDIKPISEIVNYHTGNNIIVDEKIDSYQEGNVEKDLFVWDNGDWTKVTFASGYKHDIKNNPKYPKIICSDNSFCVATNTHQVIMDDDSEKEIQNIVVGDKVKLSSFLPNNNSNDHDLKEICLFALMACVIYHGDFVNNNTIKFIYNDDNLKNTLYNVLYNTYNLFDIEREKIKIEEYEGYILFNCENILCKSDFYNLDGTKRIPKQVLNSSKVLRFTFCNILIDYGKKKFIETDSIVLASGIAYIFNSVLQENNKYYANKKYVDINFKLQNDKIVYIIYSNTMKNNDDPITNIVKKVQEYYDYDGWFYDLETQSGTFMCGIGNGIVHNSPRRGSNFVTNKVVKSAVRIKLGLQDKLEMGNMDSFRDWGHSKDYVRAMHMILNQEKPDDWVVSTMQTHSVRELCEYVFKKLDLNYEDYVVQNEKFLRPEELKYLKGDSTKIRNILGWKPEYTFETLLDEMIESWLNIYSKKN